MEQVMWTEYYNPLLTNILCGYLMKAYKPHRVDVPGLEKLREPGLDEFFEFWMENDTPEPEQEPWLCRFCMRARSRNEYSPVGRDELRFIVRLFSTVIADTGNDRMEIPSTIKIGDVTWTIGDGDDYGAAGVTPDGVFWFWVRNLEES
jgi:hypothetical protein